MDEIYKKVFQNSYHLLIIHEVKQEPHNKLLVLYS